MYKVGNKVKSLIEEKDSIKDLEINDVGVVDHVYGIGPYPIIVIFEGGYEWYMAADELELVEE
jgi:hypothetical protein